MAIAAAILLWTYVITVDNPEMTVNPIVPLTVTGQNELLKNDLRIINNLPEKITVKLSGKRDKILQLTNQNGVMDKITATLDVGSSIYKAGDYKLNYTVNLDIEGISVIQKSPNQISVSADHIVTETMPVEVVFTGNVQDDFNIESYQLSVPEVEITGPRRYVDEIERAIVEIDRSALGELQDVEGDIVLLNADGEAYTNDQISMNATSTVFTASMEKHKTIDIIVDTAITDDFITANDVKLTVAPSKIEIWGNKDIVDSIDSVTVGEISALNCLKNNEFEYVFPVVLPEEVSADVTDLAVTVKVEVNNIEKISVPVPAEALPKLDGYQNVTDDIAVEMYVRSSDAEKITYEDLKFFTTYSQEDFDNGTLSEVELRVACEEYDIFTIGDYKIEVSKIAE